MIIIPLFISILISTTLRRGLCVKRNSVWPLGAGGGSRPLNLFTARLLRPRSWDAQATGFIISHHHHYLLIT